MYVDKHYETPDMRRQRHLEEKRAEEERALRELERQRAREKRKQTWEKIEGRQWLASRGSVCFEVSEFRYGLLCRKRYHAHARQYPAESPMKFTVNEEAIIDHALGSGVVDIMREWCVFMFGAGGMFRKWNTYKDSNGETIWTFASPRMRDEFVLRWQGRVPENFRPAEQPVYRESPVQPSSPKHSSKQDFAEVEPIKSWPINRNHSTHMHTGGGHY